MLKRFVCLLFTALFTMGAQAPVETLLELRIEILSIGAVMSLKYSASAAREPRRRAVFFGAALPMISSFSLFSRRNSSIQFAFVCNEYGTGVDVDPEE